MRISFYPCSCGARSPIEHPPTGCADREAAPCLVCGAPILDGIGHDAGCMVAPDGIADYIAEIRRDIEAAGL